MLCEPCEALLMKCDQDLADSIAQLLSLPAWQREDTPCFSRPELDMARVRFRGCHGLML